MPGVEDRSFTGDVYDEEYAKQINLDGFLAELATGKLLGCYPSGFFGGAKEFDGRVGGQTYDVKTTRHVSGHLVLPLSFRYSNEADLFIFTITKPPEVDVVGYIEADEFLTDEYVDFFMNFGLRFVASQDRLQPIEDLINHA
jgi:hypothetical protein